MHLEKKSVTSSSTRIALGLLLGAAIGTALKNPGIGIAIGLTLSSGVGLAFEKKEKAETWLVFVASLLALAIAIANRAL